MRTPEEPEDEQHEEACLNNLPNHGDDDEVAPGRDFEGSVFVDFLLFDPVLGGVPDSAFEGYGALVVVFSLKLATLSLLLRPRRRAVRSREAVTTTNTASPMSPRTAQVRGKLSLCNEYGKSTCGNLYPLRGAHHQQMYQGNKRTRDNRHHEEDATKHD